jgi:hypothetical protein
MTAVADGVGDQPDRLHGPMQFQQRVALAGERVDVGQVRQARAGPSDRPRPTVPRAAIASRRRTWRFCRNSGDRLP